MNKTGMVLLAGGMGNRMKESVPKQHLLLAGKPIIMHILERVDNMDCISEIVVTCPENFLAETERIIKKYHLTKPIKCVKGGKTRQESCMLGLKHITTKNVIIHEAARPFVTAKEFEYLCSYENENAIYGLDIPFTVLEGVDKIEGILDRSRLVNVQLPQKFNTEKLLEAHEAAAKDNKFFTDDASLFFHYNKGRIDVLRGTEYNIKITRPVDLKLGSVIYKEYILGDE